MGWAQEATTAPAGQSSEEQKAPLGLSFRGDTAVVSKYVWRGQRLTNDWSLQPAMTVVGGNFSINVWGTLDMTAVNEGNALFLRQNPAAAAGDNAGLRGKFSEIDYTFSYTQPVGQKVLLTSGAITYTFPERGATLRTTSELFAGVTLSSVPLAPSVTLYVDVDETVEAGDTGLYLKLGAAHSFPLHHRVFSSLDFTGSISCADAGFGNYYYGADQAGVHDFNLTLTLPMRITERWSASAYLAYSALLGDFRDLQYPDLRDVYSSRPGPGNADTVWGGASLTLAF